MSRQLDAEILAELKEVSGNKKYRQKDIAEWSTGKVDELPGEKRFYLPKLKVNVAVYDPV